MESQHEGIKIVLGGPKETDEVTLNGRNKFVINSSDLQKFKSETHVSADCSTRTERCQTPLKFYRQGTSRNETNMRPYSTEKTMKVVGTQEIDSKYIGTTSNYTTAAILVPCLSKPITHQDIIEQLKKTISHSSLYIKQHNIVQPEPSYVPGTHVEYRTPGAHYKNKNGHIKRPMNAYMVWSRDYRGVLFKAMPNSTNSEISVMLGDIWAHMPPEEKKQYYEIAEQIKAQHRLDYPDWVFQPNAPKKTNKRVFRRRTPTPPVNNSITQQNVVMHDGFVSGVTGDQTTVMIPTGEYVQRQQTDLEPTSDTENVAVAQAFSVNSTESKLSEAQCQQENSNANTQHDAHVPTTKSQGRQLYVAYKSAFELPQENPVSNTTKGMLASKISTGREQSSSGATFSPDMVQQCTVQQRAETSKISNLSSMPMQQVGISNKFTGFETQSAELAGRAQHEASTPYQLQNTNPTQLSGIGTPTLHGQIRGGNLRHHGIRPSLANDLLPGSSQMSHQNISSLGRPLQQHPVPYVCGTMDIPILESHIGPMSAHIRPVKPCSTRAVSYPVVPAAPATRQSDVQHTQMTSLIMPSEDDEKVLIKTQTDTTPLIGDTVNIDRRTNEELAAEPDVVTCRQDDSWVIQQHMAADKLWPFPFSQNPADWGSNEELRTSFCVELYDHYDPFLDTDTPLSEMVPGSLHLDMESWKQYLEENDDATDPFTAFKDVATDDIIPSPRPLKQTLTRLQNINIQTSDTGDIITGDLLTEAASTEDVIELADDNLEKREILTNQMAIELSNVLQEIMNRI